VPLVDEPKAKKRKDGARNSKKDKDTDEEAVEESDEEDETAEVEYMSGSSGYVIYV